ncbi:hypothetical protein [Streptomyces cinereoruber]|uniref:hypothetical protein n=1 Tax=Streptomyces cinereoruber TaxID=67260 RepID=UPI003636E045
MVERRSKRTPISKKNFHEIYRDINLALAQGKYDPSFIAGVHGVSRQTVKLIHEAKTWPQYERNKAARRERALKVSPANEPGPQTVTVTLDNYNSLVDERNHYKQLSQSLQSKLDSQGKRRTWPWGHR